MFEPIIKAIENSVTPLSLGNGLWTRPVFAAPEPNKIAPLKIQTLTGIKDYLESSVIGEFLESELFIEVNSPTLVALKTDLDQSDPYNPYRNTVIQADCSQIIGKSFRFDAWYGLEEFIIALQSQFVYTAHRDEILSIVGNLANESIHEASDDGVTQRVTVRSGISRKDNATIPNRVVLAPYRTFPEITQPESFFVFRLRNDGNKIQAALFEAEGGAWKAEAIRSIRDWFVNSLDPDTNTPIIA